MTVVTVYVVFANADEAEAIGRAMIDERLAACINILGPCRSIYRWEDRIETVVEVPALFKSTLALADTLIARIADLHSYDTPAIVVWPIDNLLIGYGDWVGESVG
ncbi:MAG: divalent-cation tolerance protein CutA [Sphingomonas bacterium]|nr:divalent-cation tolerance protein CutA [Sphingomonas bacterium]